MIGYAVLCILYFVMSVALPHDRLESQGLEGIGKPSLKQKTAELTEDTKLSFTFHSADKALSELTFYFTAEDENQRFGRGEVTIEAYTAETGELLASRTYDLTELEYEAFWGVAFDPEPVDAAIEVVITASDLEEGPSIWLNTEYETEAQTTENGQALAHSLIYNAVYRTEVHYVKKPVLTTAMLVILGVLFFLLWGKKKPAAETTDGAETAVEAAEKVEPASFETERSTCAVIDAETGTREGTGKKKPALSRTARQLLGLGVLMLLVALIFYYVYDVQIRKAMNSTHREVVMRDNGDLLPITGDSQTLVQYYTTEEETLVGLGIRMALAEDYAGEGQIIAQVRDVTKDELLCRTEIDAASLVDGEYMGLIFNDSQSDTAGHTYEVMLEFSEGLLDSGLSAVVTPEGYYEDNALYVNGEESAVRLSMNAHTYFNLFLKRYFFAVFAAFELMSIGFYYLVFVRRTRIERVFLYTILCLGLLYNVILTPYMTPDESYHIDMSYRHSNTLLGIESAGENKCWKRTDDAETEFTSNPSLENYKQIYDGLTHPFAKDASLIEADATSTTEAPMILYLPAVLGMTAARLLGLGTVPMLLLARFCSLLFFAIMTWLGMRRLPFGKTTLFLLAILPMNLQQCTSFSYDAVITGTIFLYICYCLSFAWGEKPLQSRDILVMGILAIVFIYGKSGIYLPVALLALLIPAKRFGGKKLRWICLAGLLLLPVLSFINKNTVAVNYLTTVTTATATVGSSMTSAYTIGYFLSQPLELIRILANTLSDKTSFYLMSLVGQKMGWVEIEISEVIPFLFWVLLILSVMKTKEEPLYVRLGQKCWIALVGAACIGIILAGMLLTWTPYGNVSIEGVQGRYFLPLMPALLLLGRNSRLTWDHSPEKGLMYAGWIGQLLTLMYLIKAVLVL